jgi:acetate kinase
MSGSIAVINAGSSSIKFAICTEAEDPDMLFRGQVEGIGVSPRLTVKDAAGGMLVDQAWPAAGFDHGAATREIIDAGRRLTTGMPVKGVGHRIVHGGMKFDGPVRLDRDVLDQLARLERLAPLHQPHNLAPIRAIFDGAPHVAQVACFDTAFHRGQPDIAQSFALPRRFAGSTANYHV